MLWITSSASLLGVAAVRYAMDNGFSRQHGVDVGFLATRRGCWLFGNTAWVLAIGQHGVGVGYWATRRGCWLCNATVRVVLCSDLVTG